MLGVALPKVGHRAWEAPNHYISCFTSSRGLEFPSPKPECDLSQAETRHVGLLKLLLKRETFVGEKTSEASESKPGGLLGEGGC